MEGLMGTDKLGNIGSSGKIILKGIPVWYGVGANWIEVAQDRNQ
jgi:hypothetical protein